MKLSLFLWAAILMVPVVATAQDQPTQTQPGAAATASADKAVVYVYRKASVIGAIDYDILFINGDLLASLQNDEYVRRELVPGTTVFTGSSRVKNRDPMVIDTATLSKLQKEAKQRFKLDVSAGTTYYVRWYFGGRMRLMDPMTGAKEMVGLRLAEDAHN